MMIKRLPQIIGEVATSPPLVADLLTATAYDRSTVFARWRQCARTTNRPTQLLRLTPLTIPNGISIVSLQVTLYRHISPRNVFLPMRATGPIYYIVLLAHLTHLDEVSHFCLQNIRSFPVKRQTDWQNDDRTWPVSRGRVCDTYAYAYATQCNNNDDDIIYYDGELT